MASSQVPVAMISPWLGKDSRPPTPYQNSTPVTSLPNGIVVVLPLLPSHINQSTQPSRIQPYSHSED